MGIIYNVLCVSNSLKYTEEFKRIAQFNNTIHVTGVARGFQDFKNKINQDTHVVLISDILSDGTLEEVIEGLLNYDVIVFGIINFPESEDILNQYEISYVYEKEQMPSDVLNFLEESLNSYGDEPSSVHKEEVKEPEKEPEVVIEQHKSRFSEDANDIEMDDNIQLTKRKYEIDRNERIHQAAFQARRNDEALPSKVVCFTSAKGGVGKSSIALEVASCLAVRSKEVKINMTTKNSDKTVGVVIVDLNYAYGTIASTLPCVSMTKNPPSLADWVIKLREKVVKNLSYEDKRELQSQKKPKYTPFVYKINRNALSFTKQEVLDLLVQDPKTGLYILPSISSTYDIDNVENVFIEIIIEELSNYFDAVILDTGNNFESFTQTAYRYSDTIYMVAQPSTTVCVIIEHLLRDATTGLGIDRSKFKLIINHPHTNKQIVANEAMVKVLNLELAGSISHDANLIASHEAGLFYSVNNRKKQVSKDITMIANQVLPLWNIVNNKKSFVQKLFG